MDKEKEYWETGIDDDLLNDVDSELINEVNQFNEEEINEEQEKTQRLTGKKFIAFITLTIFLVFVLGNIFKLSLIPDLGFLSESFKLRQDKEIQTLQDSVVAIKNKQSSGTGFNISPDGIIVTNEHVIRGGNNIFIQFPSGKSYRGTPEIVIPELDFAILSIQGEDLPYLKVGTSSNISSGQEVLIIGNPLGISGVVKKGEIIGFGNVSGMEEDVILIRGSVHKGSSGSPVFNTEEEVIAIIFAILIQENISPDEIIGLAIPIDLVKDKYLNN